MFYCDIWCKISRQLKLISKVHVSTYLDLTADKPSWICRWHCLALEKFLLKRKICYTIGPQHATYGVDILQLVSTQKDFFFKILLTDKVKTLWKGRKFWQYSCFYSVVSKQVGDSKICIITKCKLNISRSPKSSKT